MSAEHPLTEGELENRQRYVDQLLVAVRDEVLNAFKNHGDFASAHEGYAVILEELTKELWEEVTKKKRNRSAEQLVHEAVQVAAMAVKFAVNVDRMVIRL